jgi:hypothetical protein
MKTRQRAKLEAAAAVQDSKLEKESVSPAEDYITLVNTDVSVEVCDDPPEQHPAGGGESSSSSQEQPGVMSGVVSLCSALDPGPTPDAYFSCDPDKVLQGLLGTRGAAQLERRGGEEEAVMKHCVITPDFEKKECAPPITISKFARKKLAKVQLVVNAVTEASQNCLAYELFGLTTMLYACCVSSD